MKFKDLVGKTIVRAQQMKLKKYDDKGFLLLEFSDGTDCLIEGGYQHYTGNSEDEYQTCIFINQDRKKEVEPASKDEFSP